MVTIIFDIYILILSRSGNDQKRIQYRHKWLI